MEEKFACSTSPKPMITKTDCFLICRHIVETEGARALFKGLGPNIIGVAPSRAIYFCTYSRAKALANQHMQPDTPVVHLTAASAAGNMDIIFLLSLTLSFNNSESVFYILIRFRCQLQDSWRALPQIRYGSSRRGCNWTARPSLPYSALSKYMRKLSVSYLVWIYIFRIVYFWSYLLLCRAY